MANTNRRQLDWIGAGFFMILTLGFVLLMIFNADFFNWAWDRHHNILSWYIRPLPLLPFIYFAYKHSRTGMAFSIFVLITSMAWFPKPETASAEVIQFLDMEYQYLTANWTLGKMLASLSIPLMFILLGAAFWKRSFLYGSLVLVCTAFLKLTWGVIEGGDSGWAMLAPASLGLLVTLAIVYWAKRSKDKKAQTA